MPSSPDIQSLIAQKRLEIHFQPIASIRRRNVVGVEALCRAHNGDGPIAPSQLFAAAQEQGASAALDHACQSEALRRFAPLPVEGKRDDQLILFVNVHPASVENEDFVSQLLERVESEGLEPRRVVVELLETEMSEATARRAAHQLREAGFLVALDDIGAGSSNLDRIAMVRPDILKADRALISGVDTDYHKREVLKSLVDLSEKIGGWIVAEGVETLDEALTVLDLGGDFMQGYFLARPSLLESVSALAPVTQTAREFKERLLETVRHNRQVHNDRLDILNELRGALQNCPPQEFEACVKSLLSRYQSVASVCLLALDGVQISDSVVNDLTFIQPKTVIFAPPPRGTDHSFREYFYLLLEGSLDPFVTNPYVPLPSGDLCVTISTFVGGQQSEKYVLAVHFKVEETVLDAPVSLG